MTEPHGDGGTGVDSTAVVKQGYVDMKSTKLFVSKKRRWLALFTACSKGPTRLVKYASQCKAQQDEPLSETFLTDIRTIVRTGDGAFGIVLQMNDHSSRQFMCASETEEEASAWLQYLQSLHGTASRRNSMPAGIFRTYLMPSSNLNFEGECIMDISRTNVTLYEDERKTSKIIVWPLNHIRRYGYNNKNKRLLIEAGSGCDIGEGIYLLASRDGELIHQFIHQQTMSFGQR